MWLLELASQAGGYRPMQFVSELEQTNGAAPVQRERTPRRVAARSANLDQSETHSPAPEPRDEIQVAEAPTPIAETPGTLVRNSLST